MECITLFIKVFWKGIPYVHALPSLKCIIGLYCRKKCIYFFQYGDMNNFLFSISSYIVFVDPWGFLCYPALGGQRSTSHFWGILQVLNSYSSSNFAIDKVNTLNLFAEFVCFDFVHWFMASFSITISIVITLRARKSNNYCYCNNPKSDNDMGSNREKLKVH